MALQYSIPVRNAQLDAWEATIGVTPIFHLYAEVPTANCAAAAPATLIATGNLPADWSTAAAVGQKTILNGPFTVTGVAAAGAGTPALSYRIYESTDTTCHEQGTVTITAGGGDLTLDNTSIANAQVLTISTQTRNAGNA